MAMHWLTLIQQPRAGTFQDDVVSGKDYPWISLTDPSMRSLSTLLSLGFVHSQRFSLHHE